MAQRLPVPRINVGPQALRHAQRRLKQPTYSVIRPAAVNLTDAFDPVSYLATGAGISHQAAPSGSWIDVIPATANCAVVWMSAMPGSNVSATVTIGNINAPAVSGNPFIYDATSGYNELQCFVLMNPPTGTQTVTVTFSGTNYFHATSVYYSGVASVGSPTFVTGAAGTQPSQTVTSTAGKFYAQAFAYRPTDGNSTFTTYDPGGWLALFGNPGGGYSRPLVVGDAAGTGADITFSATRNNTSYPWGGVVIPLTSAPAPPKWSNWGTATNVGGMLSCVPSAGYDGGIGSLNPYDLTGDSVSIQLVQPPNIGNGSTMAGIELGPNQSVTNPALHAWAWENGQIAASIASGWLWWADYDPYSHAFLRIREAGGTVYYETSPDASSWVVQVTTPAAFSMTTTYVRIYSGFWGTEPDPGVALWDNLNIAPSWPNTRTTVKPTGRKTGPMALRRRTMRRQQPYPRTDQHGILDLYADASLTVTASSLDAPSVTYDNTGIGANSGAGTVTSLSWNHAATAGADVFVFVCRGGGFTTVTYDGSPMTFVGGSSLNNTDGNGSVFVFRKTAVAGGTKTVAVTFGTATYASANSVSYTNVGTVTLSAAYGPAALTASQTITGADKNIVVCAQGQYCGGVDTFVSSSGGSQRYQGMGSAKYMNLVVQDTASTGSTVFTSTVTATTTVWGSIGLTLGPPAPTAAAVKTIELLSSVAASTGGLAYSLSWTHTIESNATLLVVAAEWLSQSWSPSCTVNGQAMTRVAAPAYNASGWVGVVEFFYYVNPPAGAQSIVYNGGGTGAYLDTVSYTFANAKAVGTLASIANAPLNVSGGGPNDFILNAIGGWVSAGGGFTGYNQTLVYAGQANGTEPSLFGYARGSSATFSVNSLIGSYGGYGLAALPIKPMIDIQADSTLTVTESHIQTRAAVRAPYVESIGTGSSEGVGSWTHTIGPDANLLVVAVNNLIYNAGAPTITFNGTPMTVKSSFNYGYVPLYNYGYLTFYYLWNPPVGTYTLTTSQSTSCIAQSFAIVGAAGLGAQVNGAGNGATVAASTLPDQLMLNIYGGWPTGAGQEFTGYTPSAAQLWVAPAGSVPTVYGDWINETGSTTTFGATGHTGYAWAGSILPIGYARSTDSTQTITASTSAAMVRNANVDATLAVTATDTAKLTWNMVAWESTGAGSSSSTATITWSHTIGATANCLIVAVTSATQLYSIPTCKIGSTYLRLLAIQPYDIANNRFTLLWGMMNPPTGTQTITVTGQNNYTGGNSVAYSRVGGFSAPTYGTGTGTSLSNTIGGGVEGGLLLQVLSSNAAAVGNIFTNYSQTARVNMRQTNMFGLLIGDDATQVDDSTTVTFTANQGTAWAWGSAGITLYPAYNPPTGVAFDALGHGWGQSTATSWTVEHVASQDAYVFLDISVDRGVTLSNVQYGGQDMTLLGSARFTGYSGNAGLYRYMIGPVAEGHATISGTFSAAVQVQINSVSYVGIGKTTAIQTTASDSGTPSQTVDCAPEQTILESIGIYSNAMTAPSGGTLLFFYGNTYESLVMNQAIGSSTTFATTNSAVSWGAVATVLDGPTTANLAVTFDATDPPFFVNAAAWFADSPLQITASTSADGVRNAMVDSTQSITATVIGNSIWSMYADVAQVITATPSGAIRYGAVGDAAISITATLSSLVKWALKANATQPITVGPTGDSLRNANVNSTQAITVTPTSNVTWDTYANITEVITVTPLAAEERTAMVDAGLAITAGRLGADTVEFDSVGVGSTGSVNGGLTLTWNHTINPLANYVVMGVSILTNGAPTLTAKCGGVTMTLLSSVPSYYTSPGPYSVYLYGLANPPTGTVSMTFQAAGAWDYLAANSASYFNVGTVTEKAIQSITSTTTPSITIPATSAGQRIINVWSSNSKPASLSFSNATQRSWQPEVDNVNAFLWMGDTPGTGSAITFSATSLTGGWGGIALALQPAPTSTIATQGAVTQAITASQSGTALRNAIVNATQPITVSSSGGIVVDLHGNVTEPITVSPTGGGSYGAMAASSMQITATDTAFISHGTIASSLLSITLTPAAALPTVMALASSVITANTVATSADWTGEENTTFTIDTPQGLLGVLVTLIGGGAAGGNGRQNGSVGWGGGGGARVDRTWIPAASLGPTISMTWGTGGAGSGASGNNSIFSSGDITLTAGGGTGQGIGGVASAVGITTTTHNGSNQNTDELTGNAGAGGGSGGAWGGAYTTTPLPGQTGGSSMTVAGATTNNSAADATAGNGGAGGGGGYGEWAGAPHAGGRGGKYGGGGGGGGISVNYNAAGGAGGDGYTQIIYIWRQGATADVGQAITVSPSSAVKWFAKGNVTQAITVSPTTTAGRGQQVASTQAITATPDSTGSRGQDVDSTETITVTPDGIGSRGQFIDSPLVVTTSPTALLNLYGFFTADQTITASQTANVIWDAHVDSYQVVYVYPMSSGYQHFLVFAPLFVTTSTTADSTWDTTAAADLTVTTDQSTTGSRGQGIDSTQDITTSSLGVGSRGQFLDSDGLTLTADFYGGISYGATGSALLAVTFDPITSDTLLDNHAYASLAITASRDANVTWDTTANSALTVTALRGGTFGRLLNVDAVLQVMARVAAIAKGTFGFDAAQTLTVTPTGRVVRGQPFSVAQTITATPAGGIVWHGRIGTALQITATPLGNAIWDAKANSRLTITESGLIVVSRGQDIDPALDITADTSGEFTQTMSGDVEQAILALPDTELSLGSTMDSALSLIVTYSADIGEALRGGNFFYFYL